VIVKPLLAAALVAVAASPVAPASYPITYDDQRMAVQYPLVKKVECDRGSGSAFRVGPRRFLSVAHVTSLGGCKIDGNPITVIEQDGANDFSVIEAGPPKRSWLKIDCGGFKAGWYWSAGFAWGLPYQTDVALYSTAYNAPNGMHLFIGRHTVIPGMSGGIVMNSAGEAVGTVNAYNPMGVISLSRSLSDTSVCAT
jgi:hypothetical protein